MGRQRVLGLSAGEVKGRGRERGDAACRANAELGWSWKDRLGLCPLDTVPPLTLPRFCPAFLTGPGFTPQAARLPFHLSTPRCPPSPRPLQVPARLLIHCTGAPPGAEAEAEAG